jgi:uncharacterized protein YcgI (DUF1989 family)
MKNRPADFAAPDDAADRLGVEPVVCYDPTTLPQPDLDLYAHLRAGATQSEQIMVPPREARCFSVPAGSFFRISSVEGSQVGDLNLWAANDFDERFYSGKTRALHGTHLSTGDRMWSSFPALRPMATIVADTLDWYGFDEFGGAVHDVIGTRCDPYTHHLLSAGDHYHHCCHSNLTRAVVEHSGVDVEVAQAQVHDVLNVFMCTGFMRDTGQYFMKASPVRPGDYIEFFAEIDLVGGLSACPGGNCADEHSSDAAQCHPLQVDVFATDPDQLAQARAEGRWEPAAPSGYDGSHGLGT